MKILIFRSYYRRKKIVLSTLKYATPLITKFEITKTKDDGVYVSYQYDDSDNLVTSAYIRVNDKKLDLTNKYGMILISDLNLLTTTYDINLILEYKYENTLYSLDKTISTSIKSHEHNWIEATTTSPKTCSICGATIGDALENVVQDETTKESGCKSCNAGSIIITLSLVICLTYILKRKH